MLACFLLGLLSVSADESMALFDGRSLDGWVVEGPSEFKDKASGKLLPMWSVKDGIVHCEGKGFGFLRYNKREFSDFELHVEARVSPKGNTGIGIRTTRFDPKQSRQTRPSFYSYEIQCQDDGGKPANEHCTGSLYRYVAPKVNAMKPANEWNTFDITCVGSRIRVTLNGQEIINVDQTMIAAIKDKPLKGYVALQSHSNAVDFRNVRIKELKATDNR